MPVFHVCLLTVWLLSLASVAAAQAPTELPLAVSDISLSARNEGLVSFNLRNQSSKGIIGWVLVADFFDKAGQPVTRTTEVRIAGRRLGTMTYTPGQSWEGRMTIPKGPDGEPLQHKIYIDYVLFADRSSWGPDSTHHSLKLQGIVQGWAMAYSYLRQLLKQQDEQAVASDLSRELTIAP